MNRTGLVTHPLYQEHDPGALHPESPARLKAIDAVLAATGLNQKTRAVTPRPATHEELGWVHSPAHIQRVARTEGKSVALDPDTQTSPDSYQAALLAAGGLLELTRAVVSGELDNGFALVRPPGHHAERDHSMGFCLFNNVAVAAEFALRKLNCSRVMILDWDLHHGNGSMHSFYDRADVLYLSTHQYPFYPGTGAVQEIGRGAGEGFTVNLPLTRPMGDLEFRAIFREVAAPVARQFRPELMLVSAGFDIYEGDPLGSMQVTPEGFGALVHQLVGLAGECCQGRLVLTLEGGYHVEGEAHSVAQVVRALLGEWSPPPDPGGQGEAQAVIRAVQQALSRYWKF